MRSGPHETKHNGPLNKMSQESERVKGQGVLFVPSG